MVISVSFVVSFFVLPYLGRRPLSPSLASPRLRIHIFSGLMYTIAMDPAVWDRWTAGVDLPAPCSRADPAATSIV